jgi:hypothetical protein
MGEGYLVPHLAAISDHIGHAGVHDDVTGHVQVRDALHNTGSLILPECFTLKGFGKFQSASLSNETGSSTIPQYGLGPGSKI